MPDTILIVDDEEAIRATLRRALRGQPYQLREAASAEEALTLLRQGPVDLLLTDHNMPGRSGLELCQRAQAEFPLTLRVLFTGHGETPAIQQALADEVLFHVLRKPWDQGELLLLCRLGLRHLDVLRENARLLALVQAQRRHLVEQRAPLAP